MANNNIMDILNIVNSQATQDTLAEFTQKVTKEELVDQNKKNTNLKWTMIDGAISIGNMLLNQHRQQQFENLQKNAEIDADKELKEREERLQALKDNLGITDLEKKIDEQTKLLNDIKSVLGQLQSAADQIKKDKTNKVKNLPKKIDKEDDEWT